MLARAQRTFATCLLAIAMMQPTDALADERETCTRVCDGDQTYWVEQIAEGLNFPSSMAWLPNGDMLIAERIGGLRLLRNGKLDPMPIIGTPASYQGLFDGIQDIQLDPDYRSNQALYLLLSEGTSNARTGVVYRARYSGDEIREVKRIFRAKDDAGRYGMRVSRMMFLPDRTLLLTIGEDQQAQAQQLGSHRGKILRINRDGSVPKDNPFLHMPGALPEVWSYGHRVQLGLYQDLDSGEILEVEAGPRGGDELNIIKAGGNYGWAKASWGFAYGNNGAETRLQSGPGIEDPILVWMPSVTPSGITRYRGKTYPLWNGDYFVGHLTTKALERLRRDRHRVVLQERMLVDLEERIRDVKVGPDDHLYVLTDHPNGRVLRLRAGQPGAKDIARVAHKLEQAFSLGDPNFPAAGEEDSIASLEPDDVERGRQEFTQRCASCHKVGSAVRGGDIGPDLEGVYGRLMGREAGFDYSASMAGSTLIWRFTMLDQFLANPARFRGTKMISPPLADPKVRLYIIGFLKHQSPKRD